MSYTADELEDALAACRVRDTPFPAAFGLVHAIQRPLAPGSFRPMTERELAAVWPGLPLEDRIRYVECALDPDEGSECGALVAAAYRDLRDHGALQIAPPAYR